MLWERITSKSTSLSSSFLSHPNPNADLPSSHLPSFVRRVHLHTPLSLSTPSISPTKFYTHPSLRVTFYSRLAVSPCGRYLTSGSARGRVHLWEVGGSWTKGCEEKKEREGIVLKADEGGREIGYVDWGGEGVSAVSASFFWFEGGGREEQTRRTKRKSKTDLTLSLLFLFGGSRCSSPPSRTTYT